MARKARRGGKRTAAGKRAVGKKSRAQARRGPPAPKRSRPAGARADLGQVGDIMHDLTNLATAMRAYLELLESQGTFDARQRYYIDRTKEQVDQMVRTIQDLRAKLPAA